MKSRNGIAVEPDKLSEAFMVQQKDILSHRKVNNRRLVKQLLLIVNNIQCNILSKLIEHEGPLFINVALFITQLI